MVRQNLKVGSVMKFKSLFVAFVSVMMASSAFAADLGSYETLTLRTKKDFTVDLATNSAVFVANRQGIEGVTPGQSLCTFIPGIPANYSTSEVDLKAGTVFRLSRVRSWDGVPGMVVFDAPGYQHLECRSLETSVSVETFEKSIGEFLEIVQE